MEAKPKLVHETFDSRSDRDAHYHELKKTHENVDRYSEPEQTNESWHTVYYVCYTPKTHGPVGDAILEAVEDLIPTHQGS